MDIRDSNCGEPGESINLVTFTNGASSIRADNRSKLHDEPETGTAYIFVMWRVNLLFPSIEVWFLRHAVVIAEMSQGLLLVERSL